MMVFIPNAKTYEAVTPEYSYFAGKAFGHFEDMLVDIPEKLGEVIPNFHNMELSGCIGKENCPSACVIVIQKSTT